MLNPTQKAKLEAQIVETEAKLQYQRALYRIHDTTDPELKARFQNIIVQYRKTHPEEQPKHNDPRQQTLPGFLKEFDGHGLA